MCMANNSQGSLMLLGFAYHTLVNCYEHHKLKTSQLKNNGWKQPTLRILCFLSCKRSLETPFWKLTSTQEGWTRKGSWGTALIQGQLFILSVCSSHLREPSINLIANNFLGFTGFLSPIPVLVLASYLGVCIRSNTKYFL